MSDSEGRSDGEPAQPRQKRHRFKNFSARVADVDVDVYRRLGPVQDTPLGGAASFTVAALAKWRELNSSEPFLEAAVAIHSLTETLPQLLHHAQEVFNLLLSKVEMQYALGLPAVLALHAALARDLQADYVPVMFPRLLTALAALLDEQGGEKDTEVIEQVFTCVSILCKHLSRHLVCRLPWVLARSQGLRYARSPHVRLFAAQAFGFLLRQVASTSTTTSQPSAADQPQQVDGEAAWDGEGGEGALPASGADGGGGALRRAMRALLAEHALHPTEARTDGAGLLLAESVAGVSHGLHSRAAAILELVFTEDLLRPEDFVAAGPAAQGLTTEQLRARAASVASVALERILSHLRRGKCDLLWELLLREANHRLDRLQSMAPSASTPAAPAADGHSSAAKAAPRGKRARTTPQEARHEGEGGLMLQSAYASSARSIALVAQGVHFFRGSRVESYDPLLGLLTRLMQPWAWPSQRSAKTHVKPAETDHATELELMDVDESRPSSKQAQPKQGKKRGRAAEQAAVPEMQMPDVLADAQTPCGVCKEDSEPFLTPSLTQQTLRLVTGTVYGNCKIVGASQGLEALSRHVSAWTPCFVRSPAEELLPFVAGLLRPPAGAHVARLVAARMLGALGTLVMAAGTGQVRAETQDLPQHRIAHTALGLMVRVCDVLQPRSDSAAFSSAALPLLLTAQPNGVKLAAAVRAQLQDWAQAVQQACSAASTAKLPACLHAPQLAAAWAALQLLPHACENMVQAMALCRSAQQAVQSAITAQSAQQPQQDQSAHSRTAQGLLCLYGMATEMLASLSVTELEAASDPQAHRRQAEALVVAAEGSLAWMQSHAGSAGAAIGAAAMVHAVRLHAHDLPSAKRLLSTQRMQDVLPVLLPHLADASQSARAAVLQLLCSFDQPMLLPVGSADGGTQPADTSKLGKVEVLPLMLAINTDACTLEAGRRWSVALIRQGGHLEYGRLPEYMVPALVHSLLGVLRVRFSPLWPAAVQALAACLQHATQAAWPIVLGALSKTQEEFLTAGSSASHSSHGRSRGHATHDGRHAPGPSSGHHSGDESASGGEEEAERDTVGVEGGDGVQDLEGLAEGELGLARVPTLEHSFQQACSGEGVLAGQRDSTDAANRLAHLLKALAKTPSQVMEPLSKDWVPLLLAYASEGAKAAEAEAAGVAPPVSVLSRVGARVYRSQLAEWLTFLSGIKGARGLHRSSEVQVSVARALDADEPTLQAAALRCLQAFKLKYLNQHVDRLLRLADNKTLRSELAAFPLAVNAEGGISPVHRPGLLLLLTRLLFPKLRRRTGRLAGKGALGSARAAVLNFLGFAEPLELRPLLEEFLTPMQQVFVEPPASARTPRPDVPAGPGLATHAELHAMDAQRVLPAPWWLGHMGSEDTRWWLQAVDPQRLEALPTRRKIGFLNAFEDILERLGHRLAPLLPPLIALTLRLLQEATAPLQPAASAAAVSVGAEAQPNMAGARARGDEDRSREMRSSCLKLMSQLWLRFPGAVDYNSVWGEFLGAVQPLMPRLAVECSADKEPPLLGCAVALAAAPNLLPVLGNVPTTITLDPDSPLRLAAPPAAALQPLALQALTQPPLEQQLVAVWGAQPVPHWAQQGLGGQLLRSCIAVLSARHCSPASRTAVLDLVDLILEEALPEVPTAADDEPAAPTSTTFTPLFSLVLQPWLDELLLALKAIITSAWEGKAQATVQTQHGGAPGRMKSVAALKRRNNNRAHRELSVLERLGGAVTSATTAHLLGDALAALVTGVVSGPVQRRGARARLDEVGLARALFALSALWTRLATAHGLSTSTSQVAGVAGVPAISSSLSAEEVEMTRTAVRRHWEALAPLALRLQSRDARTALAAAYGAAAALLSDLEARRAASLLGDLSAWSQTMLDEPDYDRRMAAYTALQQPAWRAMGRWRLLPVLMACLHDVRNAGDLALRQSAATALDRFILAAAAESNADLGSDGAVRLLGPAGAELMEGGEGGAPVSPGDYDGLEFLIPRVLYPQLRSQLGASSMAVRQEHLQLLRSLVLAKPQQFSDLLALANPQDTETDFFLNASHLQVHRQVRALNRLGKLATALAQHQQGHAVAAADVEGSGGLISLRCIMDVAVPLIQVAIAYEGSDASERAHDASQLDADRGANVVDAGQKALAAAASALPWQQYDQLLGMCLRNMKAKPGKATIRAVCQVLDAFHFPLPQQLPVDQVEQYKQHVLAVAAAAKAKAAAVQPSTAGHLAALAVPSVSEARSAAAAEDEDDAVAEDVMEEDQEEGDQGDDHMDEDTPGGDAVPGAAAAVGQDGPRQATARATRGAQAAHEAQEARENARDSAAAAAAAAQLPAGLEAVQQAHMIQRALVRRVLPVLHRMLVFKGHKGEVPTARAPVALAIAKLVKLLPEDVERRELPRALGTLCSLLMERQQRVRDDTRAVLVAMAKELGPGYMPYMCNVLRATLPDRGFTAHVLGYTLHAVLEAVVGHMLSRKARAHAAAGPLPPSQLLGGAEAGRAQGDEVADGGDDLIGLDAVPQEDSQDEDDEDNAPEGAPPEVHKGAMAVQGVLDDALELALPIIDNEIFGQVAAAKEAVQFANNYKEAKKVRGYESFMLLAAAVTFSSHMEPLMELVREKLHMAGVPSVRNRLSHLLQYAVRGMAANPTASAAPLSAWVSHTVSEGVQLEEQARARVRTAVQGAEAAPRQMGLDKVAAVGSVIQGTVSESGRAKRMHVLGDADAAALHYHMLVGAALQLLRSAMRRGALSGRSPATLQLLDPMVPLLVRGLRGRHAPSVVLALRSLSHLVTLPLPHLPAAAPAAGKAVTALLRRAPTATHVLSQEGLKLLAALMRACSTYQPTTTQVRFLLSWLFSERHADEALERGPGFSLLRAVLDRRLLVPEVYDVMNWVQQIMVKSQAAHVRASAASVLLQFLLDYPLGPRRLGGHLAFLAANLSYEHEEGRLQVLGMVHQVVSKFPGEVVAEQAELFTLPLVMRLVNEPSPRGRAAVAGALKALLAALPAAQLNTFAGFCKQWLSGDHPPLRRAAAQALGLLVDAEGGQRFAKRLADSGLAGPVLSALQRQRDVTALQPADALEVQEDLVGSCPGWHEAYYCLMLLEKIMVSHPASLALTATRHTGAVTSLATTSRHSQQLWEAVPPLLLHRHAWVRKAAARLIGAALAVPAVSGPLLTSRPARTGELAFSLFMQLNCAMADEGTCKQAVKCLVPLAVHLHEELLASKQAGGPASADKAQPALAAANGKAEGHDGIGLVHEEDGEEQEEEETDEGEGEQGEGEVEEEGKGDDGGKAADKQEETAEAANGDAPGNEEEESAEEDVEDPGVQCVTFPGLVRRMARLADTTRFAYAQQRLAALRWIAAVATKLGASAVLPFLDVLVVPLYRLSEQAQAPARGRHVPPHTLDAEQLGEEVMAHLRGLVGADALLTAYNNAREGVRKRRTERKQASAVRALVDPTAAAAERIRRGKRKGEGRRSKMEHAKRVRSASTYGGQKRGRGGGQGGASGGQDRRGGPSGIGKMYSKASRSNATGRGGGGGRGRRY